MFCFLSFPRNLRCKTTSALSCWITCFRTQVICHFVDGLLVWKQAHFVKPTLISIVGDTLITELLSFVQINHFSDNNCKSNCIIFLCCIILKLFWLLWLPTSLYQRLCPLLFWISVRCSKLHYEILLHLLWFSAWKCCFPHYQSKINSKCCDFFSLKYGIIYSKIFLL